ncbi:MAG TPA: hypothetical protein V6D37_08940 [Candidatus Sericytochromatia bacterium]|jgi:hypothetical protein
MARQKKNDQQARQTKVSQGKCEKRIADDHSQGMGTSAISSAATGDDEIGTSGAIRQRGDSGEPFRSSRKTISGGILRQLIEENGIQLAHYKSEVERLERRQRQLEELSEELSAKTGEDLNDEENEVSEEEE